MADKHEPEDSYSKNQSELTYTFENGQLSCLDCDVSSIPKELIEDYCNITSRLDLSFNLLESLQGLEHFKFLKELVLDNNTLDNSVDFPVLKELQTLTLNKNKFSDLTDLLDKLVASFPNLTYLSLLGNEACPDQLSSSEKDDEDYQRYRYYVLYRLPKLKFLDSTPVTSSEVSEARRVGPYQQVVRPKAILESSESSTSGSPTNVYSPLPSETQDMETADHKEEVEELNVARSYWGKNRSRYLGRNSEGNRFITDGIL
ncbi:leucine-rich melanocyte differentiation-associated protein-like isoform X1 [Biomphalaria glabrata]|uniref:Leucine-rich melanocyte differentiation-associated protein-like isoform X1 n=1 Tax=Biomphalaria glabrata TaxID=6526 RepID=A0A9U8E0L5_BIOGL|nr:leucine-rich melanocyte differentiation-associated protein-like isoform X1 [Biomphalaria glabrata]